MSGAAVKAQVMEALADAVADPPRIVRDEPDGIARWEDLLAALSDCVVLTREEADYVLRHMGIRSYLISSDETSDERVLALLIPDPKEQP